MITEAEAVKKEVEHQVEQWKKEAELKKGRTENSHPTCHAQHLAEMPPSLFEKS